MTNEGSHREWDAVWRDDAARAPADANQLYSAGTPRTLRQFWQRCYFDDLWALTVERGYGHFLELGSGRGTTSMYLAARGVDDITLVDLAENAFYLAERNFAAAGLRLPTMVLADARDTGLPAAAYDCVYNIGVLEHFEDPEPVLCEAFRLLRRGGMIFMPIVPVLEYRRSLFSRALLNPLSIPAHYAASMLRGKRTPDPDHDFVRTATGRNAYAELARQAGFADVRCDAYNPYWSINRSDLAERLFTVPAYRLHYGLTGAFRRAPRLRTAPRIALCHLLVGYKP